MSHEYFKRNFIKGFYDMISFEIRALISKNINKEASIFCHCHLVSSNRKKLKMGLPTVRKFLCCISLESGGLIIGWFNIIVSFFALFGLITAMSLTIVAYNHGDFNNNPNVVGGFAGEKKFKIISGHP